MAMVLAIMGLVGGIALPRYARSLNRYRADAAAKRVAADLTLARMTARTTNASQLVDFTSPAVGYTLSNYTDPDRPGVTYVVDLSLTPYRTASLAAPLIPVGGGLAVSKVTFDRYGGPTAGGTVTVQAGDVQRAVYLDVNTGRASVR